MHKAVAVVGSGMRGQHLPVGSDPSAPQQSHSLQGSLAYLLVLGGMVLAASYPVSAATVGAGVVATVLVQRALARIAEATALSSSAGPTGNERATEPVRDCRRADRNATIRQDSGG